MRKPAPDFVNDFAIKSEKRMLAKKRIVTDFYIPSIPGPWISKVFGLSFVALKVSLVLWRAYRMQGSKNPFKLTSKYLRPFGVSRNQKYRGLKDLHKAGVIEVEQKPGQAPEITIKGSSKMK
jgi:hypothetical protein